MHNKILFILNYILYTHQKTELILFIRKFKEYPIKYNTNE